MKARLESLSPATLGVILAVLLLVLCGATWFIVISPKQSKETSVESTIKTTQTQLAQAKQSAHASHAALPPGFSESVMVGRALPGDLAMPQILLQLSRIAAEENVTIDTISPLMSVQYAGYQAVPMTITLEGHFFAIEGFLEQLRNQVQMAGSDDVRATGRLYDVLSVNLQAEEPAPMVTATLTVDSYSYTGVGLPIPGAPAGATTTPNSVP